MFSGYLEGMTWKVFLGRMVTKKTFQAKPRVTWESMLGHSPHLNFIGLEIILAVLQKLLVGSVSNAFSVI